MPNSDKGDGGGEGGGDGGWEGGLKRDDFSVTLFLNGLTPKYHFRGVCMTLRS